MGNSANPHSSETVMHNALQQDSVTVETKYSRFDGNRAKAMEWLMDVLIADGIVSYERQGDLHRIAHVERGCVENQRLGAALEPFADLADWIAENKPDWGTDAHEVQIENWPYTLSVGWLREAHRPSETATPNTDALKAENQRLQEALAIRPATEPSEAMVEAAARDIATSVRHHIRKMYPTVVKGAPSTFLTSVHNHTFSAALAALRQGATHGS